MRQVRTILVFYIIFIANVCFGQRLTEEAYLQKVADTFSGRTNWLTNTKLSTAPNFSYESRLILYSDSGEVVTSGIIYSGANGASSYVLVTDTEGCPYAFMNGKANIFYNQENPDQFLLCESGKYNYALHVPEMKKINFYIGYSGSANHNGGEVVLNFMSLFIFAGSTAESSKFDIPTETMEYKLENGKVFSYSFEKGAFVNGRSPRNPTNIREIRLTSKKMSLIINNFRFDREYNDRFLNLKPDDLRVKKVGFNLTGAEAIEGKVIVLVPPKTHKWTTSGKLNSEKLKDLLFPK